MNPITGEKIIAINGQDYTLRFTWRALSEIETKHGESPNLFNPEVVAHVASCGMRDRHPEMTPDRIMDLSPPLAPFVRDVQQALQWAYFGPEPMPKEPEIDNSKGVKKNNQLGRWRRFVGRCRAVFRRPSSGD